MSDTGKLPAPLVPPECELSYLPYMPLEVPRLLESDLVALGTPAECWLSLRLWAKSWLQVPAASLLDDERVLAKAVDLALAEWRTMDKSMILRGWIRCSDGRIYHPVVAEKALNAWIGRTGNKMKSDAGNAKKYGKQFDPATLKRFKERAQNALNRVVMGGPFSQTCSWTEPSSKEMKDVL